MTKRIKYPKKPTFTDLSHCPALKANWEYSCDKLSHLNARLVDKVKTPDVAIVVAGSFGRLDACSESDLDYMILTEKPNGDMADVKSVIVEAAKELGIPMPNQTGVFSETIPITDMIERTGSKDDSISSLAQRMLLLMESRPIYNEQLFRDVVNRTLRKYLASVIEDTAKEALFLINDIIRYFRTICVNYEFNFWKEEDKWVMRNVKLRHSRIVMYAGLLLLVLNSSKYTEHDDNKWAYLSTRVELSPLEKIAHVYKDNRDHAVNRVLSIYDVFLRKISNPEMRKALRIDYEERYKSPDYIEMKVTSDALQTELTRFIFAQKGRWTEQVLEYLIF